MVDVRGDVLRPPHGTTPAAVKSNIKSEMRSLSLQNIYPQKLPYIVNHSLSEKGSKLYQVLLK